MNKHISIKLATVSAGNLLRELALHACAAHENEVMLLPISGGAQDLKFRVWIDGTESVHTLTLDAKGVWFVTSSLEI